MVYNEVIVYVESDGRKDDYMNAKQDALIEIRNEFDLSRIKKLAVSEKFKLLKVAKLIYKEALFAEREGITNLDKSPNFTVNNTYNLLAMLTVREIRYEVFKRIIINYSKNFERSDSYYSQFVLLGIGMMLMRKGFKAKVILNSLMVILGEDFLINNEKYIGYVKEETLTDVSLGLEIKYRPYEGSMREVKYDLLAMLKLSKDKGFDFVDKLINNSYGNRKLKFYFNIMDIGDKDVIEIMYNEFNRNPNRSDRLLMSGAYAIHDNCDLVATHYVFNSIVGKDSRESKDSHQVENELKSTIEKLLKDM
ncbi:hypothetical protein QUF55_06025 [Clostridiaceae bacterium HSG29]|nr:hypothetical protein [Clostridiaceae bacterium HSG29]